MTKKECITNLFLLGFKKKSEDKEDFIDRLRLAYCEEQRPIQHIFTKGDIQVNLLYSKDTLANGHTSKYIGNVIPYVNSFTTYTKLIDNVIERLNNVYP